MEKISINQIINERQKNNRINKVTADFIRSEFKNSPVLISRDKNSHIIVFTRVPYLLNGIQLNIHELCKDNLNILALPVVGRLELSVNENNELAINNLSVINQARNQGIGKLALQLAENVALENDLKTIIINSPLNSTMLNDCECQLFDKNLYILASAGFETDWHSMENIEGTVPCKKKNLKHHDLRYGAEKSEFEISKNNIIFSMSDYHNQFASEDLDVPFNGEKSFENYSPISVLPETKSMLNYEKLLRSEKGSVPLLKGKFNI